MEWNPYFVEISTIYGFHSIPRVNNHWIINFHRFFSYIAHAYNTILNIKSKAIKSPHKRIFSNTFFGVTSSFGSLEERKKKKNSIQYNLTKKSKNLIKFFQLYVFNILSSDIIWRLALRPHVTRTIFTHSTNTNNLCQTF